MVKYFVNNTAPLSGHGSPMHMCSPHIATNGSDSIINILKYWSSDDVDT